MADRLESESLEFHQRVRQTFRALAEAEPDRYLVVDARRSPDEIAGEIRRRVAELLTGLPLQTLAGTRRDTEERGEPAHEQQAPADAGPAGHHPHAQTGPTPQLHP